MNRPRYFVVGTDTEIGKTTVSAALLDAARAQGQAWLPFKPAVSGELGPESDHARLAAAAAPDFQLEAESITVYRFEPPIAPGLAEARHPFFGEHPYDEEAATQVLARASDALRHLEATHTADATLIEGAGGLHVPMPGGTWLAQWIEALDARPIVVARAGLGTLNHTILTVEALRSLGLPPLAIVLNCFVPPGAATPEANRRVLETRLKLPCLGVHPHLAAPGIRARPDWLRADWLDCLA